MLRYRKVPVQLYFYICFIVRTISNYGLVHAHRVAMHHVPYNYTYTLITVGGTTSRTGLVPGQRIQDVSGHQGLQQGTTATYDLCKLAWLQWRHEG